MEVKKLVCAVICVISIGVSFNAVAMNKEVAMDKGLLTKSELCKKYPFALDVFSKAEEIADDFKNKKSLNGLLEFKETTRVDLEGFIKDRVVGTKTEAEKDALSFFKCFEKKIVPPLVEQFKVALGTKECRGGLFCLFYEELVKGLKELRYEKDKKITQKEKLLSNIDRCISIYFDGALSEKSLKSRQKDVRLLLKYQEGWALEEDINKIDKLVGENYEYYKLQMTPDEPKKKKVATKKTSSSTKKNTSVVVSNKEEAFYKAKKEVRNNWDTVLESLFSGTK